MKQKLKLLIAKTITSPLLGNLIASIKNQNIPWNGVRINVSSNLIKGRVKASLFWGLYESAEARLIKKYISTLNVPLVELGASIGAVSSLLNHYKNKSLPSFHVEADARFIPLLSNNLDRNRAQNWKAINALVADDGFTFQIGSNNTVGRVVPATGVKDELCESLSSLLTKFSLTDFFLISDIEGAEAFFLFQDAHALDNCKGLIIELHEVAIQDKLYSIEDMVSAIEKKGFNIVERHGPNLFATKN